MCQPVHHHRQHEGARRRIPDAVPTSCAYSTTRCHLTGVIHVPVSLFCHPQTSLRKIIGPPSPPSGENVAPELLRPWPKPKVLPSNTHFCPWLSSNYFFIVWLMNFTTLSVTTALKFAINLKTRRKSTASIFEAYG